MSHLKSLELNLSAEFLEMISQNLLLLQHAGGSAHSRPEFANPVQHFVGTLAVEGNICEFQIRTTPSRPCFTVISRCINKETDHDEAADQNHRTQEDRLAIWSFHVTPEAQKLREAGRRAAYSSAFSRPGKDKTVFFPRAGRTVRKTP